jgi:hypothetical protein
MSDSQDLPPDGAPQGDDPPDAPKPRGKADRKAFLLRLPPELMADLRSWANQDLRSLNGHIEYLLREALKRRKGKDGGES